MKSEQQKNQPAVVVTIRGESGSGKSEIMKIIAEALAEKGVNAEYQMGRDGGPGIIPLASSSSHDGRLIKVVEEWGAIEKEDDYLRRIKDGAKVSKDGADRHAAEYKAKGERSCESIWIGFRQGVEVMEHLVDVVLSRHNDERIRGDADARKQTGALSPSDDATC